MADDEQFSLCWNNFHSNLSAGFHESLVRGDLVDVTLAAEGQFVKAHRLVLSVCSPYFRKMFTQMPANQHAFVFLKDVSHTALKDLIQFMYCGEVNVKQEALPAFISTAEALQIKGLTDSDPPASQTPPEPSTPTPQIQHQIAVSPKVRQQRTSLGRSYKIETVEDPVDEKQTTQIVIQTTASSAASSQPTIATQSTVQQHQSQHGAQQQISGITLPATTSTTVVSHKRSGHRSIGGVPHVKRQKSVVDPLEATDATSTQITVQTGVVGDKNQNQQQTSDTEYIDLPIELPTKSEPEYADETGDVDQSEQDTSYVEDEAYSDMRYDETYFTENEDGSAGNATVVTTSATGVTTANASTVGATTSKALIKQSTSFSDSTYMDNSDQTNNDAQDEDLHFIESPWATPCLVLYGYMFNCHSRRNSKEYWRCHNYSKKNHSERCRIRCVLDNGKLKSISGGGHNHPPHTEKIKKMLKRPRMISNSSTANLMSHINFNDSIIASPADERLNWNVPFICNVNATTAAHSLIECQQLNHNSDLLFYNYRGQLVYMDYVYSIHNTTANTCTINWRCTYYHKTRCPASLLARASSSYLRKRIQSDRKTDYLQIKGQTRAITPSTSRSALRRSRLHNEEMLNKAEANSMKLKGVEKVTLHKDVNDTDTIIKCSLDQHTLSVISRPRLFGLCVHCLQKPNADRKKLHKITTYCPKCPGGCWTCEKCFDERHPIN